MTQPSTDELKDYLAAVAHTRRQFPKCVTCERSIRTAKVNELDLIQAENQPRRLAHKVCPIGAEKRGAR